MALQNVSTGMPVRSLDEVPGPRGWPWIGNALQIRPQRFHQQLEAWAREHEGTYRLRIGKRRFLVIADAELIASVLRQRPDSFRRTTRLEQVSRDMGFYGLFAANGDAWRRQRPMVLAGLDPAHIRTYLPAMVDVAERLRSRWERAAREGAEIDLLGDLMRFTVDVTTSLAFGRDLRTLEQDDAHAIQQHLNAVFPALTRRILSPFEAGRWDRDQVLVHHVTELRRAVDGFIAQAREQLSHDPSLRTAPRNLIQALVAARDGGSPDAISDEELAGNVLTMLLAGEDTTANTLAWMIWLLHRHPAVAAQARREVDGVLGHDTVPRSIEALGALDHVEACAHETMRLKPVAPMIINEALHDVVVGDVLVPKGSAVMCVMRPPAMDPHQFRQPEVFQPARWLEGGDAAGKGMGAAKRASMPFGAGARMCPGRYLALAEMKMVIAMLLGGFELERVAAPDGDEPAERFTLTMAPVGLRMKLRLRQPQG